MYRKLWTYQIGPWNEYFINTVSRTHSMLDYAVLFVVLPALHIYDLSYWTPYGYKVVMGASRTSHGENYILKQSNLSYIIIF